MIKQITGISIQLGSKTFNLYDDIKVAILDFEAERNTQHVALKDYSYIREDDSWQPKDLELVFNTFQDLSNFQEFINEFDKSYLLTFKYGGKEFRTYVAKKSSVTSSRNNGAFQRISMTLQQQTPYFVIVSREYILPDGEDETEGVYPFNYPLTYAKAGKTNTFSFGRLDMVNSGDKVSAIKLEIYGGLIVDSAVSIEDYAEYTENSYKQPYVDKPSQKNLRQKKLKNGNRERREE